MQSTRIKKNLQDKKTAGTFFDAARGGSVGSGQDSPVINCQQGGMLACLED
ncbi:hypothetical protein BN1221_02164c [Brenneria goodwinii]|uniref:Uncharacterized protein n=1 Tax=Brenneria goodwinii TaxID=1109412 RepID=A0A0G4JUX7_9GAMM|nr:hypothetical protein BN1221_02164c [Brenneria goodwinii]